MNEIKDELSEVQKHRQRISKETAKAQKQLKIIESSIKYHMEGNKIIKTFTKTNNNNYSLFVGFKEVKVKESTTGRKELTPAYLELKKKGFLK